MLQSVRRGKVCQLFQLYPWESVVEDVHIKVDTEADIKVGNGWRWDTLKALETCLLQLAPPSKLLRTSQHHQRLGPSIQNMNLWATIHTQTGMFHPIPQRLMVLKSYNVKFSPTSSVHRILMSLTLFKSLCRVSPETQNNLLAVSPSLYVKWRYKLPRYSGTESTFYLKREEILLWEETVKSSRASQANIKPWRPMTNIQGQRIVMCAPTDLDSTVSVAFSVFSTHGLSLGLDPFHTCSSPRQTPTFLSSQTS